MALDMFDEEEGKATCIICSIALYLGCQQSFPTTSLAWLPYQPGSHCGFLLPTIYYEVVNLHQPDPFLYLILARQQLDCTRAVHQVLQQAKMN
jgi:hypothetical protein